MELIQEESQAKPIFGVLSLDIRVWVRVKSCFSENLWRSNNSSVMVASYEIRLENGSKDSAISTHHAVIFVDLVNINLYSYQ